MAQGDQHSPNEHPRKGSFLLSSVLFLGAGAAGVAVPFLLPDLFVSETLNSATSRDTLVRPHSNQMAYVPFGEVTVNLDEGRMNRYLRLKIALQVEPGDSTRVEGLLKTERLVLRNWLLSHLSDKQLNEIRGKAGQNMLRREIRDAFNTTLFADGYDRIHDILFEEFNVQ